MARFYAEEMQQLNGTGWIDKAKGTVHIPIADCDAQDCRGGHSWLAGAAGETAMKLAPSRSCWRCRALFLTAAAPPPDLGEFAYRQRLGNQLPLDTVFRDETGRSAALRDLLGGKPAILALVYFHCPNLCGIVRTDLFDALARTGMMAGRDYTLIALSIDPSETAAMRRRRRRMICRAIRCRAGNRLRIS